MLGSPAPPCHPRAHERSEGDPGAHSLSLAPPSLGFFKKTDSKNTTIDDENNIDSAYYYRMDPRVALRLPEDDRGRLTTIAWIPSPTPVTLGRMNAVKATSLSPSGA